MLDPYEEIVRLRTGGRSSALATIIGTQGSAPRETGAKMLVRDDGTILGTIGGGSLEGLVIGEAMLAMRDGQPRTIHYDLTGADRDRTGMICGGVLDVYIEPIVPAPTVLIFGGGHISLTLSKISVMAGFEVTVIDDREEFANTQSFPEAKRLIVAPFSDAFPQLNVNRSSYLVIVTRGHAGDQEVLEWALTTDAFYIGMIGSREKVRTINQNLEEKGISKEALLRVHAPISLEIGALTPQEIAVAIVAQMIQVRRKKVGKRSKLPKACMG